MWPRVTRLRIYSRGESKTSSPSQGSGISDLLWKQYDLHIKLYSNYLELLLKFNMFYYAVTGAIVSYYFGRADSPLMKYALLFPILMSVGFCVFFFYAAGLTEYSRDEVNRLCAALGLNTAPEYRVLKFFLYLSGALMLVVAISLLTIIILAHCSPALFAKPPTTNPPQ